MTHFLVLLTAAGILVVIAVTSLVPAGECVACSVDEVAATLFSQWVGGVVSNHSIANLSSFYSIIDVQEIYLWDSSLKQAAHRQTRHCADGCCCCCVVCCCSVVCLKTPC